MECIKLLNFRTGQYFFWKNKCFHVICAEAATLLECGCNLYNATQDGVVSIPKYVTSRFI